LCVGEREILQIMHKHMERGSMDGWEKDRWEGSEQKRKTRKKGKSL